MSDNTTTGPAGASEQAPAPEPIGPMDLEAAVSRLAEHDQREAETQAEAAPEAPEQQTIDNPSPEDTGDDPEPEGEETAPTEDAEPAEEAESEAEPEEEQYVHGNARTRLRDGTVTTVGELKKLAEEAKEYRAKAPEITAQLRQIEERTAQLAEREQFVQQHLPVTLKLLQDRIPPEPDSAMMDESNVEKFDPIRYQIEDHKRRIALAEFQQEYGNLSASLQQQQQQMQAQAEAEARARAEAGAKALVERVPDFAVPEKAKAIFEGLVAAAKPYGISAETVHSIQSPEAIHMFYDLSRDAAAYRKLMAQKKAVEAKVSGAAPATQPNKAAPVQQPGRRVPEQEVSRRDADERLKRWRESPDRSIDSAVEVLASLP